MENNPNCPQFDDFDYYKITSEDIIRLLNSQFRIKWQFKCYVVRDTKNKTTVAMGFYAWVDALVH